jgi:transcription-repair coupling factor (superfamily II helicase)
VLKKLEDGKVDVIIGTHRLLSKDVRFNDIGLLIIDEEHRFGVVQKERIKSIRANIDVLAMSATPIPRTLHMALMGARDLSQINTPPPNRQPIETDVVPFSEKVIKDAILYETERGGQVFFVHNRIESIHTVKRMLERVLPNVRFAVAHGKMDEDELSRVMVDFIEGSYDVLISTMIIESGLDLPNVNTMIVNRADRFGVAQLHQLRGRIGRSSRKAYAYLLVPPKFEMSRIARERLAALTNFSSLGAGFQVAMRDLEIRGAGNLLGREQSGYINAVGFEMYQRLIEEAVREVQIEQTGGDGVEPEPVELKLKIEADAFFPEPYMPEGGMRLNYYRELSRTKELAGVKETESEVADRFGKLPEAAQNLFDMVRVRILGEKLGAEKITIERPQAVIEFPRETMPREQVLNITARSSGFPVDVSGSGTLSIRLPLGMVKEWHEKLGYVIRYLIAVAEKEPANAVHG